MRQKTTNLNSVQKELLKIFKVIKTLCEQNNISYYAVGGTALGAVRHNGFIPWDDDIDLGIPINEYDRFLKIFKKQLPAPYKLTPVHLFGCKIHNTNTTFLETQCIFSDKSQYFGIFIDIFPIIGAPNDDSERREFLDELRRYHNQAFVFDRYPSISKISKKDLEKWGHELMHRYELGKSNYAVEFATGYSFVKNTSGMKHPTIMKFEDTTMPVPSSFDEDLKSQYGDYLTLPPPEQRHVHNDYAIVDTKKPYSYYYNKIQKIDPETLDILKLKDLKEGLFFENLLAINYEYEKLAKLHDEREKHLLNTLNLITNSRSYKLIQSLKKAIPKHRRNNPRSSN